MIFFLLGGALILGGAVLIKNKKERKCIKKCTYAHAKNGDNYKWLLPLGFGNVEKIEFQEPPSNLNDENWVPYTEEWWNVHCKVISHNPENLVEDHMNAFVYKDIRFAKLRFTFSKGKIITSDNEDLFRKFYELERDYFQKLRLFC